MCHGKKHDYCNLLMSIVKHLLSGMILQVYCGVKQRLDHRLWSGTTASLDMHIPWKVFTWWLSMPSSSVYTPNLMIQKKIEQQQTSWFPTKKTKSNTCFFLTFLDPHRTFCWSISMVDLEMLPTRAPTTHSPLGSFRSHKAMASGNDRSMIDQCEWCISVYISIMWNVCVNIMSESIRCVHNTEPLCNVFEIRYLLQKDMQKTPSSLPDLKESNHPRHQLTIAVTCFRDFLKGKAAGHYWVPEPCLDHKVYCCIFIKYH